MVEHKLVTCPETGHLEELELEHTSLGVVVTGCSRYAGEVLSCPRECARRMDQRERAVVEDRERVLVVVASFLDSAAHIATALAETLARDKLTVELAALDARAAPPVADYDAVIIGARAGLDHHDRMLADYIREQRDNLAMMPTFLYCVRGHGVIGCETYARRLQQQTGWTPTATWTFVESAPSQRADVAAFARLVADEIPQIQQPSLG